MRKITALRTIFLFTILAAILASCNKRAQLLYISDVGSENLKTKPVSAYLLKPGDVLYIQIITQDPNVSSLFNNRGFTGPTATNIFSSEASYYLYGYSLSDSGQIRLPVLGAIAVGGLTIDQARERIQEQTQKFLTDGLAIVKLLSYKVTVLGEVKRPGTYTNFKDNLSIFEAIGMAGDLADYGERATVLIVRQTTEGVKTMRVNLHDKSIINSEAYYLLPNDMVIVEPRKGKIFSMNSPNISLYLSIITTTLLLMNYLK